MLLLKYIVITKKKFSRLYNNMESDIKDNTKASTNGYCKIEVILETISENITAMKRKAIILENKLREHEYEFQEVA
jgi:hypothetical protein